ncbi:hypothetical protein [Roseicyclus persicicus]|uniref:Uncharacterized protein n=1 Tax=Roseicyclus persicicus TaxID=2650661 RepID=A0A7X6H1T7_9RHOB|nr:hypothetical protein [Roseibacterium persicicum]NKX46458.1 hypothetical protein [Roseibacterium persicicum]
MHRTLTTLAAGAALWLAAAVLAQACPSTGMTGATIQYSAAQLQTPQVLSATAQGFVPLSGCPQIYGGVGYAEAAPDYTFYFNQMGGTGVIFDVQSDCDSTLIAHTPDGAWHFNDDGGTGLMPQLTLGAVEGRVDLWLGTYHANDVCPANLTVRAVGNTVPQGGCPNPAGVGQVHYFSGPQLTTPQQLGGVPAQGRTELWSCSITGTGYVDPNPAITLQLSQMDGYLLELSYNGSCDGTMLVRTADQQWRFDDDSAGNWNPRLQIEGRSANGTVNVWVGRYGQEACMGTLSVRAIPSGPQPQPPVPPQGAGLAGTWNVNANGFPGTLSFQQAGGGWTGIMNLGSRQETLLNVLFDPASGRVEFLRPNPGVDQHYVGTVSGSQISGQFNQSGGGYEYGWSASR